jgi:hypothetical protein
VACVIKYGINFHHNGSKLGELKKAEIKTYMIWQFAVNVQLNSTPFQLDDGCGNGAFSAGLSLTSLQRVGVVARVWT